MIWTPERLSYHQTRYHLLWHPIWAGLGEVENPHGFVWSDYTALQFARSKDPTVEFNSPGFEEILRNHVFSTFRKDPLFFVIAPLKKMHHFTKIWIHYLPWPDNVPTWLSVLLFWFGVLGSFFGVVLKKDTRMVWILVPLCFYFSIPILISSRFYFYNNAAYLATSVCLFYSLTEGISWGIRRIFQREV
jgi:hypothetical protein